LQRMYIVCRGNQCKDYIVTNVPTLEKAGSVIRTLAMEVALVHQVWLSVGGKERWWQSRLRQSHRQDHLDARLGKIRSGDRILVLQFLFKYSPHCIRQTGYCNRPSEQITPKATTQGRRSRYCRSSRRSERTSKESFKPQTTILTKWTRQSIGRCANIIWSETMCRRLCDNSSHLEASVAKEEANVRLNVIKMFV
jgi:hypothetical protein